MGFNCGIVGLPNVGKSTIFNALTKAGAEAANYPFCTIEPNVGMVDVPDERLDYLSEITKPKKTTPAVMKFVDIAGLVEGASKGEGLGNKFLGHIRSVSAIAHVVRCFEDSNVTHVSNTIDPLKDVEVIDTELILSDLESLEGQLHKLTKLARGGDKKAKKSKELIEVIVDNLNKGVPARKLDFTADEKQLIKEFNLLTVKPVLYVANVAEEFLGDKNNDYIKSLSDYAGEQNAKMIKLSGKIEAELSEMDKEDALLFLEELGASESGLERLIRSGYKLLDLITYFTAGEPEVRAWTVKKNSTAPEAAAAIHTDISRGFIRAEVTSYEDVKKFGGLQAAKDNGRMRLEGKEYIVQDGDVMYFRFNV